MQQFIDGTQLHDLFCSGYKNLKNNMTAVNDLNVFPVPDGDTGTNMVQTFGGGLQAVSGNVKSVSEYMQQLSKAVLLSARGNSGVIFSQFIHGLYRGFVGKETIRFSDLSYAFSCSVEDAYSAIVTPTEGTILTVIREAADFLAENGTTFANFESGFDALVKQMKKSLANTPNLLPVLKEAGVVDSGGAGLLCFAEGICAGIRGEVIESTLDFSELSAPKMESLVNFNADSVLDYGYCTEFVLQLMNYKTDISAFDLAAFKAALEPMGDSIVAVKNDSIVKTHIHTFAPETVLGFARSLGEFVSVKIENMSIQHNETQTAVKKEKIKYAIVTVASGDGIIDYFYNIGADVVIDGGQTNNPSVNAFLDAFDSFDAENIIVLPNNSNIIFTANQAAELYSKNNVHVIPTKSIVEGYSALSMMNLWCDTVDELIADMSSGLDNATTAYVTAAIRDSVLNGVQVKKDEYLGLEDKTLLVSGDDRIQTAFDLINKIAEKSFKEVIILFCGESVTDEETARLEQMLAEKHPTADIGFVKGNQKIYDFIISLE